LGSEEGLGNGGGGVTPSIGGRLRAAREAGGISVEDAYKATKIQPRILAAMEEDRVHEMLEPAYAKVFLKKYAGFLGLDGSTLVEEYLSFLGPVPEQPLTPETEVRKRSSPWAIQQVLIPTGIGLVALIGFASLGSLTVDLSKTLAERKDVPVLKGKTAALPVAKATEASRWLVPRSVPLKLTIRVKQEVWMQVKSDGMVIFQNVLTKGAQESWTAKEELELWTGNAAAMELQLNGRPLGSPGHGVMKGIKITREGLKPPK
jgi:cytoskeletal protein RodZ